MSMSLASVFAFIVLLATAGAAFAEQPVSSNDLAQFAYIRPTHRLIADDKRTVRRQRPPPGMPQRKSGNIAPLNRELPKAIVEPPKTRRRAIPW